VGGGGCCTKSKMKKKIIYLSRCKFLIQVVNPAAGRLQRNTSTRVRLLGCSRLHIARVFLMSEQKNERANLHVVQSSIR